VFRNYESTCTPDIWDKGGHCQQSLDKDQELWCLVEWKEEE